MARVAKGVIALAMILPLAGEQAAPLHEAVGLGSAVSPAPDYYLWAWRREENIDFIDPDKVKAAIWIATITLRDGRMAVERRANSVTYPTGTEVVAVVRLEVAGTHDAATAEKVSEAVFRVGEPLNPVEYQIDFDAGVSQRAFYRRLLGEIRQRIGGARLSMTALASWCFHDDWMDALPVDAVVPMIYRMGPHGDFIRRKLFAEREFPSPLCRRDIGYSADEPMAPVDGLRRIFLFHPEPWSEERFADLLERVSRVL